MAKGRQAGVAARDNVFSSRETSRHEPPLQVTSNAEDSRRPGMNKGAFSACKQEHAPSAEVLINIQPPPSTVNSSPEGVICLRTCANMGPNPLYIRQVPKNPCRRRGWWHPCKRACNESGKTRSCQAVSWLPSQTSQGSCSRPD